MRKNTKIFSTKRREFLGSVAGVASTLGLSGFAEENQNTSSFSGTTDPMDADTWFEKVKGKHRVVFDVPSPRENAPFAWPRNFLASNKLTGTPENECGVVVVFRHRAIVFMMDSPVWEKYKFGEVVKFDDPLTKTPAIRNAYWKPAPGDFKFPGLANFAIGINELQDSGVMFCVCATAIHMFSNVVSNGADPAVIEKEFLAAVLPGVQVVPSGVWALGRAQEKKCGYIFVG